ncbi:Zinc finger in N-recognin family protein [Trichomonas vaginalis G3]|uniref:E3 ubiquitin-protein ligase n=1 Tax=Trichomonas vaginalis (strain ATCC PRA-98 / G3) TaxID=412133 RepID=A2E7J0_TRIV3|nr:ubiquitin-dependent protein catabolic process via the N-end rule pathway [Trichomonas vaginalis G3]EAY11383.1 Zinc finger in N-recognin family protein [Trichomonas vaginalis G3]KAI5530548.1 ubiquitin-dependent protein catabolic process via the N-end rule pathway [Trichomonas vaginalis G3]|eukprot:XP_001323606.1 Zinc finger in N-recognin family protein [Trichomonas vaginalis G3]
MRTSIPQDKINISPTSIIDRVEKVVYGDYTPKQWGQYVTQLLPKKTCGISWTSKKFALHCETCQNDINSCVCLKCFLNGKHEGHQVSFRYSSNASCDCGDKQLWKEEGFCPDHPGCSEHLEKTDIPQDLYQKYELVFQALIKVLPLSFDNNETNAAERIVNFMLLHTSYGDAIRRCFTLAFSRYADIPRIFDNIHNIGKAAQNFSTLLSNVSNDPVFRRDIAPRLIFCLPIFVNRSMIVNLEAKGGKKYKGVEEIEEFSKGIFHWFSTSNLDLLFRKGFNWPQQAIAILRALCILSVKAPNMNTVKNTQIADILGQFDSCIVPEEDPDAIKNIALQIAERLVQTAGIHPFTRQMNIKVDDPNQIQSIVHNFEFTVGGFMTSLNSIPKAFSPKVFDVFAEYIKNKQPEYGNVLDKSTEISQATALYILLEIELRLSNDIPKWLDHMATIAGITRTELCSRIACLPIKHIAASRFAHFNKYVRNDDETYISLISLSYKYNLQYRFAPLFALVQICAEYTEDINSFMKYMAITYGVLSDNEEERSLSLSIFVLDSLFLVTDRSCFMNDSGDLLDSTIVALLKSGDKSYSDIQSTLPNIKNVATQIPLHINNLTKTITTGSKSLLTLKDSHPWTLGVPWVKTNYNYSILNEFSAKNKEIPFSFPLQDDDRKGLLRILSTPAVKYSAIYLTSTQNTADGQLLNGYLNVLCQLEGYNTTIVPSKEAIRPDINNFDQNLTQLIINTYDLGEKTMSLTDLAKENPTTAALLAKFGVQIGNTLDKVAQIKKNKERARAARERAIQSLNINNNLFNDMEDVDDEADLKQVCSICQEEGTEPLNLPVFVHTSLVPSIIEKSLRTFNTDHSIKYESYKVCTACQHICHSDCVMRQESGCFYCSLCRGLRNDMIPLCKYTNFDIDEVDLDEPINGPQDSILNYTSSVISQLISSSVVNLEARHRMNPGALDSPANSMLYKSLFAIAWKKAHMPSDDLITFNNNKLCNLVKQLSMQDKPGLEYTRIVKSICEEITDKEEIYPFMRRAAILQALIFSLNKDQFFEWDEYLEYENLCQKFCIEPVKDVDISVIPFKLINLPQCPVELYRPPFDEDTMPYESEVYYCLLDKHLLIRQNDQLQQTLNTRYKGAVIPVIQLTNEKALSIKYVSIELNKFFEGPRAYYSLLGQPVIGLESSDILSLSQDKVTEIEDDLLSGNFTRI